MAAPFILRTAIFLTGFGALLLLERAVPYARSGQSKAFRVLFHFGISVANSLILYFIMTRPILKALSYTAGHSFGGGRLLGLDGTGEVAATVMIFDCWDYWMHRANHRIPFLWRFHKAHHSDMELDVTTSARFHLGELAISNSVKYLMIFVWGPSLRGLVSFDILLTLASQFHHSNLSLPPWLQDPLERVIVTPRMHRCHHALHPGCFNTNFSTILSIWDRLGGSYHRVSESRELEQIGLREPRGEVTMQLGPFLLTPVKK